MTFIASERNAPVPPSAPIKLLAEPVMLGRPVSSTIPAVYSTIDTAGIYRSAGLPNITGAFSANNSREQDRTTGAFTYGSDVLSRGSRGTSTFDAGDVHLYSFNASRSSSIYGNSTTVQPASLTSRYYIKY